MTDTGVQPVESFAQLAPLVSAWDGNFPSPEVWKQAEADAQHTAGECVRHLEEQAARRIQEMAKRQVEAARLRLQKELGRYLVCFSKSTADLNNVMYRQMSRDIATAQRLEQCMKWLVGILNGRLNFAVNWTNSIVTSLPTSAMRACSVRRSTQHLRFTRWVAIPA